MEDNEIIDNSIYERYGERWYTAQDDPVALLRAENETKIPWILNEMEDMIPHGGKILDVGCGGGFLSNALARKGFSVTGVDLSEESLKIARAHDETRSVTYEYADAFHLPYQDESFDVVTAMDFLEHIEKPEEVIKEFSRVLRPGGLFFFHTFNRSLITWLVVIKLVEWFVKNTARNMHILRLFIKPKELEDYCLKAQMRVVSMTGIKPVFSTIDRGLIFKGIVPKEMKFSLTSSKLISYLGMAVKISGSNLHSQIK